MKALTLKQVKSPLELVERPELVPAAGEVVVRIKAAALNRRDYWITQGMYPGIRTPVVLGSDGAGVVTLVGEGVDPAWTDREVIIDPALDWGDRLEAQSAEFTILGMPRDGTLASEVAVPVTQLHAKPEYLDWPEAGALPLGALTAYRALFRQGCLRRGEQVLITGAGGGVATFLLQLAVAAGAEVWTTSSSAEKIRRAVELGASGGFDYTDPDWVDQLAAAASPPNLVVDGAGGEGYGALLRLAAPGGRIVSYGATAGPVDRLDLFKVFWKQLRLQGTTMGSPADFQAMLEFVGEHGLRPVIDRVLPLSDGDEAIASMKLSPQFGKIVLTPD